MADWYDRIRGKYQNAMSQPSRDLAMILAGIPAQPAPPPPNYNAIPLNPPQGVPMPPAMNLGPLPPMNADAQQADDAARMRPMPRPQPQPQPAAMPTMPPVNVSAPAPVDYSQMPMGVGGEAMPPSGANPTIPLPQQYNHLNPTPSLEEVFRREYAANPAAFGKLFG